MHEAGRSAASRRNGQHVRHRRKALRPPVAAGARSGELIFDDVELSLEYAMWRGSSDDAIFE